MAEILGLGISHYPPLSGVDSDMAGILRNRLEDPSVPAQLKDPAHWPLLMQQEWGNDNGLAAASRHRADMVRGLRKARQALDAFKPDVVLIWGDDQYENFKEDIIPPFCVLAYEDMRLQPWRHASESAMLSGKPNAWNEPIDFTLPVQGHPGAAKAIARALIEAEFDVAYAYKPLHHPGLAHAFLNSILYLDYDRKGFPYPVVPFSINCYGESVISARGFITALGDRTIPKDPPAPSPKRCFDLGAALAPILAASPWRVALVASSSWSHAFLTDKTHRLQPDTAQDKQLYQALVDGRYHEWRDTALSTIIDAGDHELLNWMALLGAMNALDRRCTWSDFVETYVFNSNKVTAIFEP